MIPQMSNGERHLTAHHGKQLLTASLRLVVAALVTVVAAFAVPVYVAVLYGLTGTLVLFYRQLPAALRYSVFLLYGLLVGLGVAGAAGPDNKFAVLMVPLTMGLAAELVGELRRGKSRADK